MNKTVATKTNSSRRKGIGRSTGKIPKFHFSAIERLDVPQGRKGKHRTMVTRILEDLSNRSDAQAVRVPLSSLQGEKVQNLRSALNRITRLKKLHITTASDAQYLYIWNKNLGGKPGPEED